MKTRLFIVILLVISALPSMAMDTVIYRQPSSGAIAEQTGTVEQFLRDGLVITSASGQSKTIPAELVIEIKTARPDLYQQALIRMEQQDYEQALPLLEKTVRGKQH